MKFKPLYALMIGLIIYALTAFDAISGRYQLVEFKVLMNGISCSLIVFALVRYEIKGKVFLKYQWAQLIGAASYVLYLIHYPVISTLSKVAFFLGARELGLLGAILTYVSILLASIMLSIIFHLYIEKPISKKLKAFTNHRQQSSG